MPENLCTTLKLTRGKSQSLEQKSIMASGSGSSLFLYVGLLGSGYVLGRIRIRHLVLQLIQELYDLPLVNKVS